MNKQIHQLETQLLVVTDPAEQKRLKKEIRAAKKADKAVEDRIAKAYRATCCGIQINILDIPKVFKYGERIIAEGASNEVLLEKIGVCVRSIAVGGSQI